MTLLNNKKCPKCNIVKLISLFNTERSGRKLGKATSWCKECSSKASKNYYDLNKEKAKLVHKIWVNKNKEKIKIYKILNKFKISSDFYNSLIKRCVICYSKENLVIDHSHRTGKIRGVLCDHCNKGLGFFKDNPTSLLRAADYLFGNINKKSIFKETYDKIDEEVTNN